jgi:putative DNA methylase
MKKKLIEVALPLEAINAACKSDKDRKTGHIRNIHKWFAPMPLPALRAILFATVLDAPENPDGLESRLNLIASLVANGPEAPDSDTLNSARKLLRQQLGSSQLWVLDPFCGGGSTMVEAQRLGLQAEGSDLNPIPVLISRCLTVFPKNYLGQKPLMGNNLINTENDTVGLVTDIKGYAARIGQALRHGLADVYPRAPNGDSVIYWWWAHTVPSPDPAFAHCLTPLVTSWWLSLRSGDHRFLIPEPNKATGQLTFRIGTKGSPPLPSKDRCLFSEAPITYKYVREQAQKKRLGRMLLAYVSDGESGRKYWVPDATHENAANSSFQVDLPSLSIPQDGLGISVQNYGIDEWSELFTPRQQKMLSTLAELIRKVPEWVQADGGSEQYGRDIAQYLGLGLGKLAQASSKIVRLNVRKGPSAKAEPAFARGDIQLNWDFAETNPFGNSVGDWNQVITTALRAFGLIDPSGAPVAVKQADARNSGSDHPSNYIVVTDPPYFAAIGYADLSEYFYFWMRLALKDICPDLFATVGVPKLTELIASPARQGGRSQAAEYFISGFTETFSHLSRISDPKFPIIVVYAQRQEEQSR